MNGKAAAVAQDAEAYQRLLDAAALAGAEEVSGRDWRTPRNAGSGRPGSFLTSSKQGMAYLANLTSRAERDLEYRYREIRRYGLRCRAETVRGIEETDS